MVWRIAISGFHHALEHFEGLFFGVVEIIGEVSALRLWSNHSAILVEGSTTVVAYCLINSSSSGQGVGSQCGDLFAVGGFGGLIFG